MKYLHLIWLDKFTKEFINFISQNFSVPEHRFIVYSKFTEYLFPEDVAPNDILFLEDHMKMNAQAREWFHESDLIIVSGLFGCERCLIHFPPKILKKTYLMFWGGDFHCMKNNRTLREKILNTYEKYLIRNCAGVINLIEGDYSDLCKYVTPRGKHFVAPMCEDDTAKKILTQLHGHPKNEHPFWVLVGNSATESNQHSEILKMLERFKEEDFRIICPLSYGNSGYAETVIQYGKKLFGEKFIPLTEYMDKKQYFEYIAKASVAIYNNNRQQAMGNINVALALDCKVFIRNDTVMWRNYADRYVIHAVQEIPSMNFEEFISAVPEQSQNWDVYQQQSDVKAYVQQWQKIFDSVKG